MSDTLGALQDFMTCWPETIKPTLNFHTDDGRGYCRGCVYSRTRIEHCIFLQAAKGANDRQITKKYAAVVRGR